MATILNVDHWDWVHPETQKVTRLRRGDEVPAEVLSFIEDGGDSMYGGRNPVLLKTGDAREAGPKTEASVVSQGDKNTETPSPKQSVDKK
ncbi:MAG TPA: hypothetical protein VJ742_03355 [Nitrososphaera sp.]|nr:hypothetical protein [Nitrososphaera sp.]